MRLVIVAPKLNHQYEFITATDGASCPFYVLRGAVADQNLLLRHDETRRIDQHGSR